MQQKNLRRISGFFVIFWADENIIRAKEGVWCGCEIRAAPVSLPTHDHRGIRREGEGVEKNKLGGDRGDVLLRSTPPTGDDISCWDQRPPSTGVHPVSLQSGGATSPQQKPTLGSLSLASPSAGLSSSPSLSTKQNWACTRSVKRHTMAPPLA